MHPLTTSARYWRFALLCGLWLGAAAFLMICPPWEYKGQYVGHEFLHRVWLMEVDKWRLLMEEVILIIIAGTGMWRVGRQRS